MKTEINVRSLEYLRHLSRLVDGWEEDSACQCCDWAVEEIERLRAISAKLQDALQSLYDWQNGPPLLSPKWKDGWGTAMMAAEAALNAAEQAARDEPGEGKT
jgi:hypothetical protein